MNFQQNPVGIVPLFILLLIGFSIAQIVSFVHIFFSNAAFYDTLTAVHNAGYLAVPNIHVANSLLDSKAAFYGGLFFSLTSGICLSILSIFAAWIWHRLFHKKKTVLFVLVMIWASCIFMVNYNGFSSLITLYLLLIPCTIFPVFGKLYPIHNHTSSWPAVFFHLALFVLFSIGCATQMKIEKFLDVRDFVLLTNPAGQKLNAFYYDNSLYSANYFKSFSQKLIKTCDLNSIQNKGVQKKVSLILSQFDYLPLPAPDQTDLAITIKNTEITFLHHKKPILVLPAADFMHSPGQYIKRFESKTDPHALFRYSTMIALLLAGAILLYTLIFVLPFFLARIFVSGLPAGIFAGLVCLVFFFILFGGSAHEENTDPKTISTSLASENPTDRIHTLRYIVDQKIDITAFPVYKRLLRNGEIPERYWLAKALSRSRIKDSRQALLQLLEDKHFNVVCMALYSMGNRGVKRNIPIILEKIKSSRNWYVQWYAYKALRKLGWRQKILN